MRSIEAWLNMNLNMVKFSIQGLELQRHGAEEARMTPFAFAHGTDWRKCVERLGRPGRGLGFVYFTDLLADESKEILDTLRSRTGVADWVGTVGTGVIATGTEYQDEPALAAMVAALLPVAPAVACVTSAAAAAAAAWPLA